VRALYARELVQRGDLPADEENGILADLRARLADAYAQVHDSGGERDATRVIASRATVGTSETTAAGSGTTTRVDEPALRRIVGHLRAVPDEFAVHPKLQRMLTEQADRFDAGEVDWPLAEALAFGSLVLDGVPVRLVGQDTRRGTFSQRHGTLVAQDTEAEYTPLAHLGEGQAPFMLYDSTLSEYAALGFEYGYSVEAADALVCWEAQFGDFANGAQIVIDQFLAAGTDKWGQVSRLTLLLPHGYEGQGPEHSSARIERYLQLCATDNLRVAYPSTAAQYFHLLRRQARHPTRVPLVCFTPKRYLRMPQSSSTVQALTGGTFAAVLDDPAAGANHLDIESSRVLICTGKIGHELIERRDRLNAPVAVVRVEELFPFPVRQLRAVLARSPNAALRWVQEEPANMGAWSFVDPLLEDLAGKPVEAVARPASASTATGSMRTHQREQEALLERAFADD
jgi:2-oxoglutarate dehydrogenase E1 component